MRLKTSNCVSPPYVFPKRVTREATIAVTQPWQVNIRGQFRVIGCSKFLHMRKYVIARCLDFLFIGFQGHFRKKHWDHSICPSQ